MCTPWRARIWLALRLAAFTLEAPSATGEVERSNALEIGLKIISFAANRSSVDFQLNYSKCAGLSEPGLIFDLAVLPSDQAYDVSSVYINGQALFDLAPESTGSSHHPYGSLNSNGTYHLTTSRYMAYIMEGGAPTLNRFILNVDQFDSKVIRNIGFDARIIQVAGVSSLSKSLVENANLPKLLSEVDELRGIKDSIKELKCEIKHKKRQYKEKKRHVKKLLKTEYWRLKKEIKNCDGFGCATEAYLHKVRDTIRVAQHYRHHHNKKDHDKKDHDKKDHDKKDHDKKDHDKKYGKHTMHHEGHQIAEAPEGQARPWHPPRPLLKDGNQKNFSSSTAPKQSDHRYRHHEHRRDLILKILGGIFLMLAVATSIHRHRCKGGLHRNRRRNTCWDQSIIASYSPWRPWIQRREYGWGRHPRSYDEKHALIIKLGKILQDTTDAMSDIARPQQGLAPSPGISTETTTSITAELPNQTSSQLIGPPQYEKYDGAEVNGFVVDGLQFTPRGTEFTPSDASSVRSVEINLFTS